MTGGKGDYKNGKSDRTKKIDVIGDEERGEEVSKDIP